MVYYGNDFSDSNIQLLSGFDVVVLDPNVSTLTPAIVARLQNNGVAHVLGYISIGEEAGSVPLNSGDGSGPLYYDGNTAVAQNLDVASYYLDMEWDGTAYRSDGTPDVNATFSGRFVFPNDEWRQLINEQRIGGNSTHPNRSLCGLQQIASPRNNDDDIDRTANYGFDGFFLDTLDTASPYDQLVGAYPWAAEAMRDTVKFIRENNPEIIIMQNRGLFFFHPNIVNQRWEIKPFEFNTRSYVDAVLFESYMLDSSGNGVSLYFGDNKHNYGVKLMAEAARPDGFRIFSLDYDMGSTDEELFNAMQETVLENGWIEYISPNQTLNEIGLYAANFEFPQDNDAPVWDSTAAYVFSVNDVSNRVGLQDVQAGENSGELMVFWDVARDYSRLNYDLHISNDSSFNSFSVVSDLTCHLNPQWEIDSRSAASHFSTIENLSVGTYFLRIRARDAYGNQEQNDVVMSIELKADGPLSNPGAVITVDGDISEWASLADFGSDPDDISSGTVQNDWRWASMAHNNQNLYIAYQNDTETFFNWGQIIYLDTIPEVGFGLHLSYPLAADFMIQGQHLYRYTGDGSSWQWEYSGVLASGLQGSYVELAVNLSLLEPQQEIKLFFAGDNWPHGGSESDFFPDHALQGEFLTYHISTVTETHPSNPGAGINLDGNLEDWSALTALGTDTDDIDTGTVQNDWRWAGMAHDSQNLYIAYKNDTAVTMNWGQVIYLDTDPDDSSGFGQHLSYPLAADYMIQGQHLFHYIGDGSSWQWEYVATLNHGLQGDSVELSLSRTLFGSLTNVKLFFVGDNAALGSSGVDYFPNNALQGDCFNYSF